MRNATDHDIRVIAECPDCRHVPFNVMFEVHMVNGKFLAHKVKTLFNLDDDSFVIMETSIGQLFRTHVSNLFAPSTKKNTQKKRKTYKRASKMQWLPWDEKYLKEGALVKCRNGVVHKLSKEETYPKTEQLLYWFSSFNHKTGANRWEGGYDIVSVLVDNRELTEEQRTESSYKFISLLLTPDEAQVIRDIIGHCVIGDSEKSRRKFADSVFDKLKSHTKRNSLSETGISPEDGHSISFEDET